MHAHSPAPAEIFLAPHSDNGNCELVRPLKSIFDDLIHEKRASQDEAAIEALAQFEANCMDQGFETVEDITSSAVFTETIDALAAGVSVGLLARFARRLGNHVWLPAPKTHAVAQRHKGLRPGPQAGRLTWSTTAKFEQPTWHDQDAPPNLLAHGVFHGMFKPSVGRVISLKEFSLIVKRVYALAQSYPGLAGGGLHSRVQEDWVRQLLDFAHEDQLPWYGVPKEDGVKRRKNWHAAICNAFGNRRNHGCAPGPVPPPFRLAA